VNRTDLDFALEDHDLRVQLHGVDSAEGHLRGRHPEDADTILAEYERRIGEVKGTDRGLIADDHEAWYLPKREGAGPRWTFARSQTKLPEHVLDKTSATADEILARLDNPRSESIKTRGLVLGHVQSGKTTSFLSVAAKAADNGFDLVIILAGVHNSLRRQTQDRAASTIVHNPDLWWLGTLNGDFRSDGNTLTSVLGGSGKRGLLVVKKHQTILRRLAEWLESESDASLRQLSVLVIDDEADQAGLDVSDGPELAGVHKQLMRIVNLSTTDGHSRCAYLAYTATPYANILTSQAVDGLYPRSFIYPLDKPDGYVGADELFGDWVAGDPVNLEPEDNSEDPITDGLDAAITWFVLATAARAHLEGGVEKFHSSMLIHTTQLTEEHLGYRPAIENHLRSILADFENDPSRLRSFYETTKSKVSTKDSEDEEGIDEDSASWEELEPHVPTVLKRLLERTSAGEAFVEDGRKQHAHSGVIVDNSKVDWSERLTYSKLSEGEPSVTVIAIGGNTLSRGLTLEGLICSYFARTARTYDSLMQMGRWFGYRHGYRHLVRIWTTQGLLDWFTELNQVEQELRDELVWMQNNSFAPDQYGPRIRTSPNMNITRAAAMRSVSREVSYSDFLFDPSWLDLRQQVLEQNKALVMAFAESLGDPARHVEASPLFTKVPMARIRSLLSEFQFHAEEKRMDTPSMLAYIDKHPNHLGSWNVLFKSVRSSTRFDYGGQVGEVGAVSRARLENNSVAYIGSLVDSGDHRLDVGSGDPVGARYRSLGEPPLLVFYAIDRYSAPRRAGRRVPLDAPETPIAMSLALPYTGTRDYVMPALAARTTDPVPADLEDHANV